MPRTGPAVGARSLRPRARLAFTGHRPLHERQRGWMVWTWHEQPRLTPSDVVLVLFRVAFCPGQAFEKFFSTGLCAARFVLVNRQLGPHSGTTREGAASHVAGFRGSVEGSCLTTDTVRLHQSPGSENLRTSPVANEAARTRSKAACPLRGGLNWAWTRRQARAVCSRRRAP